MAINFDLEHKIFHLQGKNTSYVMQVIRDGYLDPLDRTFSLDTVPHEYPAYGNGDFRTPAYQIQLENGSTITDLRYLSHRIYKGKPKLEGRPATYVENDDESETLELIMKDPVIGLKVTLIYTVFNNLNVITRSVHLHNQGTQNLKVFKILSANVDFRDDEFELLTLYGSHTNEKNISRRPLVPGTQLIESRRGASSPQ